MTQRDRDDHPFDKNEQKLREQFLQVRDVIYKVNDENQVVMAPAKVDQITLAAMRYMKNQQQNGNNSLDPDRPVDGAALSKANPMTGVAAGQYMAFYQGTREEYEKLRVMGVPTSELGCPAHTSLHDIRTIESELQQQKLQLAQRQETDRQRDQEQARGRETDKATPVRSIFS
jgi:hypothetical protein